MRKRCVSLFCALLAIISVCHAQIPDSIPAHDSFQIASTLVGETRTINVWTPPGYAQGTEPLMVMYMPDGGVGEDFPHIANTLSALIQSNRIPPMILVGIENTQRRRDLTGPTEVEKDKKIAPVVGGSADFRAFIREELFTEIGRRYRITDERGIIGESLAGLFIVETLLTAPDMFDYYIAMDPSLWWNDHYLVSHASELLSRLPGVEKRLWFAGSDTKDISKYTRELTKILEAGGYDHLKWQYSDEPKEEHSTIYRATKEKALIWIFNTTPGE